MKKLQFTCRECGFHDLGYQKYVKCITPVTIRDNQIIESDSSIIDKDDFIWNENGYVCLYCEASVEHCGDPVETEADLLSYLALDPKIREEQQREHDAMVAQMAEEEEQRQKETEKEMKEYCELFSLEGSQGEDDIGNL